MFHGSERYHLSKFFLLDFEPHAHLHVCLSSSFSFYLSYFLIDPLICLSSLVFLSLYSPIIPYSFFHFPFSSSRTHPSCASNVTCPYKLVPLLMSYLFQFPFIFTFPSSYVIYGVCYYIGARRNVKD